VTPRDIALRVQVRVARRMAETHPDQRPLAALADLVAAHLDGRDPEAEFRLRAIIDSGALSEALQPGLLGRIRLWFRWRALRRALRTQRLDLRH
jgi:hypothetical protein